MREHLLNLVHLHKLDQEIKTIKEKLKTLPTQIETLDKSLQKFILDINNKKKEIEIIQKEKRQLEHEVDSLQDKKNKFKEQIKLVKTNKEYTALLQEISIQENAIRAVEDEILEKMELIENLQIVIKEIEKQYQAEKEIIQKEKNDLLKEKENYESLIKIKNEEKQNLANKIPENLMNLYNYYYQKRDGVAMAEARDEICLSCNVRLRPQLYEDIKKQMQLYICDSCHRILYYIGDDSGEANKQVG